MSDDRVVPDIEPEPECNCCRCKKKLCIDAETQTQTSFFLTNLEAVTVTTKQGLEEAKTITNQDNSTYWCQMGRELRQIADDLRECISTSGNVERNQSYMTHTFLGPKPSRRRSLPDGYAFFRRPL